MEFTEENIRQLFGHEDALRESKERFKEYFYYNRAYDNITNNLPLRIIVGDKGMGKSALIKRSQIQDSENNVLSILIRPDDTAIIGSQKSMDFNQKVRNWKTGILKVITQKVYEEFNSSAPNTPIPDLGHKMLSYLVAFAEQIKPQEANEALKQLTISFMRSKEIRVYIDDVDRGWTASRGDVVNISALINAIKDISSEEPKIKFRLALRTDVYYLVRTSDESMDKVESDIVWLEWKLHEILCIAAKRIESFFGQNVDQKVLLNMKQSRISKDILSKIMDAEFSGRGHWAGRPIHNVIISLVRRRPRDMVKLLTGAAKLAQVDDSTIITSSHLNSYFPRYSEERLRDIINEFRSELPAIEELVLKMKPTKAEISTGKAFYFTQDELIIKLKNIISQSGFRFTKGQQVTPKSLLNFLYKIDFITARKDLANGTIERSYYDKSRYLASEHVQFGYSWEVHPAYRWALQPGNVQEIIDSISLNH